MKKLRRALVAALVLALTCFGFAACGGDPLTVTLDKETLTLEIGNSETLTATLSKEGEEVTWSTSAASVATVSEGVVTGVSEGTATITATAGDAAASCTVTVQDTAIRRVTLSDDNLSLTIGGKYTVTAKLMEGTEEITGLNWNWTCEMAGIASVIPNASDPSKGRITALGTGDATIFASTTYRNKNYQGSVQLKVTNDVAFSITPTAKELSAAAEGAYPNTAEFSYSLVVNDEPVTTGVTWRSEDTEIASVDDTGRVTAHREGTVKIFAEYKKEGYDAYATVTVFPVERKAEEQYFGESDELVLAGNFESVTSVVRANGGDVEFEKTSEGIALLSDFEIGEHTVVLKDGVYATSLTFVRANLLIADKSALDAWGTGWKAGGTEYVLLTADIPYNGSWVRALKGESDRYWDGTLDGRGHVISNITFDQGSLVGDNFSGTVKNLVMTGVKVNKNVGGTGAICDRFRPAGTVSGARTIENCYVSGTVNGTLSGLIVGYSSVKMGTVKNCVVAVEAPLPVGASAICSAFPKDANSYHPNLDIENCVVIGASAAMRNKDTGADYTPDNVTAACFTEREQIDDFDYSDMGFGSDFWDTTKTVPMPKGFALEFAITSSENTIAAGSEITLSVNSPLAVLALKEGANDAGVTLVNGVVTVPMSAAGKSFTVTATAFDGTVKEKTFEVLDIEEVAGITDVGIADLSKTSVDWSTAGFDGTVRSITDSTGKTLNFTAGTGTVSIAATEFGADYGVKTFRILTDANKRYTVTATVASYVISDLDTLKGWQAAHPEEKTENNIKFYKNGYVVLTASIDFGGVTWEGWANNTGWNGTFDGRGNTISNIKFVGGATPMAFVGDMFGGTLKNLVMTDVTLEGQFAAALCTRLGSPGTKTVIENCYVSGKLQSAAHVQGLFVSYSNNPDATVRNCVAVIESGVTQTSKTAAILNGYTTGCPTVENCIVVGAPKAVSEAVGFGAGTADSLETENTVCLTQTSELDTFDYSEMGFDADIWSTAGSVPVPKGLSLDLVVSTSVPEAEISAGSEVVLSANYPLTKFTLSEPVEGITLSGNTLSIADSAAGKSFTLVATGFDGSTAQKTLTVANLEDVPGIIDLNAFDLSKGTVSIDTTNFEGEIKGFADAGGSLTFAEGDGNIEVAAEAFGAERGKRTFTFVTDANKRYQAKAVVADYVISDVASLNGWQAWTVANAKKGYVVLDADIDYEGAAFAGLPPTSKLDYFLGTFDGRGHKISNVQFNGIALAGDNMAGTVQNVVIENAQVSGNTGAIAVRMFGASNGLIENCFVSGTIPGVKLSGLVVGYSSTATSLGVKNSMAVVTNQPENNMSGAIVGGNNPTDPHFVVSNCVAVGVAPVVMNDGSASTADNIDVLSYADAAAFETGAADAVAKLGASWSWDAETKTLSLLGTAVYTLSAAE